MRISLRSFLIITVLAGILLAWFWSSATTIEWRSCDIHQFLEQHQSKTRYILVVDNPDGMVKPTNPSYSQSIHGAKLLVFARKHRLPLFHLRLGYEEQAWYDFTRKIGLKDGRVWFSGTLIRKSDNYTWVIGGEDEIMAACLEKSAK